MCVGGSDFPAVMGTGGSAIDLAKGKIVANSPGERSGSPGTGP